MRKRSICHLLVIPVALLSLSTIGRGQSPAPSKPIDIYFLPVSAPRDYIAELQEYFRTTLHLETEVLPAFQPGLSAWNAQRSEWSTERLTDEVIEHVEDRLRAGHATVIAITGDQLRSDREGWVFGWRNRAGVGILSYAALRPRVESDDEAEAILRTRLRRAVTRYIGLLHFGLPTSASKRSLMSATVNAVADHDDMDDDLAAAGFFSYRPLLAYDGPVSLASGIFQRQDSDLVLDDTPRVSFERHYRSNDTELRWLPFGVGTNHSYGSFLIGDAPTFSYIEVVFADGSKIHYRRISPGTGYIGSVFLHEGPTWTNSRITWKDGGWLVELPGGVSYTYPACPPSLNRACTLSGYRDASGREIRATFNADRDVVRIESEHHHTIELAYNAQHRIVLAWDDAGGWTSYGYDDRGRLTTAAYANGESRGYGYDGKNHMTRIHDQGFTETLEYDADGRCTRDEQRRIVHTDAAGHDFVRVDAVDFAYSPGKGVLARNVRLRSGRETRFVAFDADGYEIEDLYGEGTPMEQRTVFDRAESEVVKRVAVTCGGARHLAAAADVTVGQAYRAIATRLRSRCDADMHRPR